MVLNPSLAAAPGGAALTVICLCADWCTVCREFAPNFEALAAANGGDHFRWVDIEDEPELLGELDITTFPTLIVARAGALQFAGAVLAHRPVIARLLESARRGDAVIAPALRATYQAGHDAVVRAGPAR
jgi:thiol-disulfide isomerase/thioredoxin